jgi:outer membrane immunogenic protein
MAGRWLAGVLFASLAAGSALAADMPPSRYIPPPRAPAFVPFFSWTGFYAGINGGYGWGKSSWTDTVIGVTTGEFDTKGALAGVTLGYNAQVGGITFGLEADFDWSNIKGSTLVVCPTRCETTNEWLGTFRGRLGYAFDRFLPFVTGGMAFGGIKAAMTGAGSYTDVNVGWSAGGGIEYAFANNFTAKVDYLYVDLGKINCNATCSGVNPFDVTFTSQIVRGGLNYKF